MSEKKLLIADDSLTIQKVIRLALSNEGYEIQAVAEGNEAIEQISVFRPHVVLIDVSLPSQSAFEVKKEINRIRQEQNDLTDVKFVLMSSAFETVDEEQAKEAGFDGRLTKPFDPASLREVLSSVLNQTDTTEEALPPSSELPPLPQAESDGLHAEKTQTISIDLPEPPLAPDSQDFDSAPAVPPPFPISQEEEIPNLPPPPPSTLNKTESEITQDTSLDFSTLPPPPVVDEKTDEFSLEIPAPDAILPEAQEDEESPGSLPMEAGRASSRRLDPESEIRHLTESTIQMSGLDELQWSIDETGKRKADVSSGSSEETEQTGSWDDGIGSDHPPEISNEEPMLPSHEKMSDDGDSTFDLNGDTSEDHLVAISSTMERDQADEEPHLQNGTPQSIDSSRLEKIVELQVEEALRRMTQKILPEIAEKVIKQEIHRMLSDKQS